MAEAALKVDELEITDEQRQLFLEFIEELDSEKYNCTPVNHTNHTNHSNW